MENYIVLLPSILFIIAFVAILKLLQKAGADTFLKERIVTKENSEPVDKSSTSRFVLLLSGFTAVILGVSIVTYYLWASVKGKSINTNEMESVTKVLLALGIGVVPYAFNQLKDIFK